MEQKEVILKCGARAVILEHLSDNEVLVELLEGKRNGHRRPVFLSDIENVPSEESNEPEQAVSPILDFPGAKPALGTIDDEPDSVYFAQNADKPKIGSSLIKEFIANKKLFYMRRIAKTLAEEPTKACYGVGHYIEDCLLKSEGYALSRLVTVPVSGEKTKAWKEAVKEADEHSVIMLEKDLEPANAAIKSTRANPDFKSMMESGKPQQVFRVEMKHFYLQCKVDWLKLVDKKLVAYDMKSTMRIYGSGRNCFDGQIWNLGYHIQSAIYRMIMEMVIGYKPEWSWAAVEKQEPYDFELVWADPSTTEETEAYVKRHIDSLIECFKTGNWENTSGPRMVMAPPYIINQLGE